MQQQPTAPATTATNFDDGMGGSGAASDGRHFNHDNTYNNGSFAPSPDTLGHENGGPGSRNDPADQFEPLRNLFTDLFGGFDPEPGASTQPGTANSGAPRRFGAAAGGGAAGMLFNFFGGGSLRGNWGDYAWGEQGLDNILTQLMEQATQAGSGNAPPPAPEEAIAKLERFSRRDAVRLGECLRLF